ncbi:hypothetical protein [Marinoscillum sp. MHG1-6]|uniref:hypothetical protein n=1 Tax=Marinoscillum sp. MHG1-6 TaxID=2959627 RepID=UPI0021577DE6|nr:hypothetical protein [Marinoscillum sp. MHG1-6]
MRLIFVIAATLLSLRPIYAQIEDSTVLKSLEFLEEALTYSYMNKDDGTWWVNRFSFDEETQKAHFRTSSAENPLKINGKRRVHRIFSFSDLDPYSIYVQPTEMNLGLIVEGKLISLPTVKNDQLITKQLNGQTVTPQSVLLIPIPTSMDSASDITNQIIEAFKVVILDATNIEKEEDSKKNMELVFETMMGDHLAGDLNRYTIRKTDYELRFAEYLNRQKILGGTFGFDPAKDQYYEDVTRESGQSMTRFYKIDPSREELVLKGIGDAKKLSIELINKSMYLIKINEEYQVFHPRNSRRQSEDAAKSR